MNEKKYHVDYNPVSAKELIQMARNLSVEFDQSHFYSTSKSASILHSFGHIVGSVEDENYKNHITKK